MKKIIEALITHLSDGHHVEGMALTISGYFIVVVVNIYFMKQWTRGLVGSNGRWEQPEVVVYFYMCWLAPGLIIPIVFMEFTPPDYFWYFMGAILLFSLSGRMGLEWLMAKFPGGNNTTTVKERVTVETSKQQSSNEGSVAS